MNIVMFTNTFSPHVGGVANSVAGLVEGLRELGHKALVVAPVFPGASEDENQVIRIPALQQFGGSDFSLPIPASRPLAEQLDDFAPDIVHSHHPFLLGGTALRVAAERDLPVIYTYHTHYEQYGHYVVQSSEVMKRLALNLSLGYCELCDAVIAPSESTAAFLADHNVNANIVVIPSGVNTSQFETGDATGLRREIGIPEDAFVVGHVGRLAPEKNLEYLSHALIRFLGTDSGAHALIAGDGTMMAPMRDTIESAGLSGRVHLVGVVTGERLASVYAAMNVFAFSSLSETQGLVLAEAMASGTPVVALDASGSREVIEDGKNGRLLPGDAPIRQFAACLSWMAGLSIAEIQEMQKNARQTSKQYSRDRTVQRTLKLYRSLLSKKPVRSPVEKSAWSAAKRSLAKEWKILGNVAHAVAGGRVSTRREGK